MRFDVPGTEPGYLEKYFTKPISKALKSTAHVSMLHAIATKDNVTMVVFFEDGVKFAEGEELLLNAVTMVNPPKKFTAIHFTELCGDDLSQSNLMHIAKTKKIKPENILDNVITISADMASHIMPEEEYTAMFSNECNEADTSAPLYVLE